MKKNQIAKALGTVMVSLLLLGGLGAPVKAISTNTFQDQFPDAVLAAKVATACGAAVTDEITATHIANLTSLDAYSSGITSLEGIGLFTNLTSLAAYGNNLTSLPEEIGNLVNLNYFTYDNNAITALPSSIGNLTSLTYMDGHNNLIAALPDSFYSLSALQTVSFENNRLTTLGNVAGLTSLVVADFSSNQLTAVPLAFNDLEDLAYLDVRDNQIIDFPPEVYNRTYFAVPKGSFTQAGIATGAYAYGQNYSKTITAAIYKGMESNALSLPIFSQVLEFYDTPILTYLLVKPDASEVLVTPEFRDGVLFIPGSYLDQLGAYTLHVFTDDMAIGSLTPSAVNLPNESLRFNDASYELGFAVQEAPAVSTLPQTGGLLLLVPALGALAGGTALVLGRKK